jgi:carbon storage regulator
LPFDDTPIEQLTVYRQFCAKSTTFAAIKLESSVSPPFTKTEAFMLVLTRQEGEKIYIGDKIVVEVTRYSNGRVRLGVEAPPDTVVLRGELHDSLKENTGDQTESETVSMPTASTVPTGGQKNCG